MEANWKEELYFLESYKKAVATQLNWGDSEHWRHSDFVNLSEKIFEKTGTLLSHTTLKRIWGKLKYDSLPTPNTLNALAQYLDYENWLAFKTALEEKQFNTDSNILFNESKKQYHIAKISKKKGLFRMLVSATAVLILVIIFISFIISDNKKTFTPEQLAKVQFSSQPVAEGVPNTVIFNYDLGDIQSKDIQIQQSWDSTKRFRITEITNEAASTYYRPGYWRAKLIVDGQIIKEHDVFIKSKGWLVTQDFEPQPRYFLKTEWAQADYLGIDSVVLVQTLNSNAEPAWLTYHYIENLGDLYSNNFIFEASVKNTYQQGNGVCQESRVLIMCENGFIGIPLSIPGCVGDLRLRVFDYIEDGDSRDLSAFGCDFSQWQKLRCEVKNGVAILSINGKIVRKIPVSTDAGRIVGMRAAFRGAGIIDDITFYNGKTGQVIYQNSFNPTPQ